MSHESLDDRKIIKDIEAAILSNVGGRKGMEKKFSAMIRRALDEVIDMPRTGRLTLEAIEQTEKTYIGTKIEILFRSLIGFPKGIHDLNIDGVDVDIKNTVRDNWTIPPEILNKPCILIRSDEKKARCWLGIVMARPEYLNPGKNRDGKTTLGKEGRRYIHWVLSDHPYPSNMWESVEQAVVKRIFKHKGGTERLVQLFKEMPNTAISRTLVDGIAQQKDYMKRLRKNGGARDKLAAEGIALLWGGRKNDATAIKQLGLPLCTRDDFIAYKAKTAEEKKLLKLI